MIIVSGTIVINPENVERAEEIVSELMACTREEPGNLSYGFYAALGDSGRYRLYEEWESQEAIDAHNASAHFAAFMAAAAELGITEVEINQHAVTDKFRVM